MLGLGLLGKYIFGLCQTALLAVILEVVKNTFKFSLNDIGTATMLFLASGVSSIKSFVASIFVPSRVQEAPMEDAA